jgi:hypothetical protein
VLRPNYLAPLTTTNQQLPATDLVLSQWWTKNGLTISDPQIYATLRAAGFQDSSGNITVGPGSSAGADPVQYLLQHGYTHNTSYQPDGRFWTFRWIEFGWLVALSLLLLGTAFWLLRRRSN